MIYCSSGKNTCQTIKAIMIPSNKNICDSIYAIISTSMLNLLQNEFIFCGKIAPTFHFYFLGTVKTKNGRGRKVESKRPRPNFSLLLFATVKNGLRK